MGNDEAVNEKLGEVIKLFSGCNLRREITVTDEEKNLILHYVNYSISI